VIDSAQAGTQDDTKAESIESVDPTGSIDIQIVDPAEAADFNSAINNSLILLVAVAVLVKLDMAVQGMTRGWTPSETALRLTLDNWKEYYRLLSEAPIQTRSATSAAVYTIGDIIAQRSEGVPMGKLDRGKIFRNLLAGALAHGPLSHCWYELSQQVFHDCLHWAQPWSFFPKFAGVSVMRARIQQILANLENGDLKATFAKQSQKCLDISAAALHLDDLQRIIPVLDTTENAAKAEFLLDMNLPAEAQKQE